MTSKTNATIQRVQKLHHVRKEGSNWVLIAGSALLSTLTIKFGFSLKRSFERRRQDASKEDRISTSKDSSGSRKLHSSPCHFDLNEEAYKCSHTGGLDVAKEHKTLVADDSDVSLPPVGIPPVEPNKDTGSVLWISSPDRLEMPRKPLNLSNCSDSPCVSDSGSDVYSKREVIQKLRHQLKRRDEMILEMQAQITEVQNSLNIQSSLSENLQAQLDCTTRDLFTSEREIQHLRKVIADHCVAEVISHEKPADPRYWHHQEASNGSMNGYPDSVDDERARAERGRIEMLRREVQELKEVIEGKDFLLHSYKEQKVEMCSKMKELQLKLASQVANIL